MKLMVNHNHLYEATLTDHFVSRRMKEFNCSESSRRQVLYVCKKIKGYIIPLLNHIGLKAYKGAELKLQTFLKVLNTDSHSIRNVIFPNINYFIDESKRIMIVA